MRLSTVRKVVAAYVLPAVLVALVVIILRWINFYGFLESGRHVVSLVVGDSSRVNVAHLLSARQQWRLLQLEERYTKEECRRKNITSDPAHAWITALGNDVVALPAIVAGHSIRKLSCQREMIALVSSKVSKRIQNVLVSVGYRLVHVESLDCNWMDRQQGLPERNLGFPGTFMRFYIWSFSWLRKVIYFDPDYMILSNIDELFDLDVEFAASQCSRPGVIDLCFNAGLAVIRPNRTTFLNLMSFWRAKSTRGQCPNDQNLLWLYFKWLDRWTPLPFAYNIRRRIYSPLKTYHFAGGYFYKKPWNLCPRPSRRVALGFEGPVTEVNDVMILWWKLLYEAIDSYGLKEWWQAQTNRISCSAVY